MSADTEPYGAARTGAVLQAAYYIATGVWPLVDRASFERVSGPKVDFWLARMVGALTVAVGLSLGIAAARNRRTPEIEALSLAAPAAFAAIDLVYVMQRRISPVYLADAALQGALAAVRLRRAHRRIGREPQLSPKTPQSPRKLHPA
jgi:hypothetical protein